MMEMLTSSLLLMIFQDFFGFLTKKTKYQTFEKFNGWKTLVEKQTDKKLKFLRPDNGLEFLNKNFNDLCAKYGITRHKTVRLNPQ